MLQKTPIEDVLTTHMSHKRDDGYQTPNGDFNTLERVENRKLTAYGRSVKTLERDKRTETTAEVDICVNVYAGGHETPHGSGNTTPD